MAVPFFLMALVCVVVGIFASIAVTSYVSKRGVKINYFLWRIMIFKYFNDYQRLTREETGRTGALLYVYIVAMIMALTFAVIGAILK